MNRLQKLIIIIAAITIMGALAVAGIFAAVLGILFLPIYLALKKQDHTTPQSETQSKPKGNIIEADFKRVDKE